MAGEEHSSRFELLTAPPVLDELEQGGCPTKDETLQESNNHQMYRPDLAHQLQGCSRRIATWMYRRTGRRDLILLCPCLLRTFRGLFRSPATCELTNSKGFAIQKAWVLPVRRHRVCLSEGIGFACQKTWLLPVKKPPFYISKGRFSHLKRETF